MKQGNIIAAYKTLAVLNRKPGLPFGIIQKFFLKKKELEPYWQMQGEQETVLIEATGQTVDDYKLTPEIRRGLLDISETDVEYDEQPVEITITEELSEKLGLTAEILEHLDGFVTFTEG